jgi:N-acyl-phosphatidylethanolamine-hydrolysing phospholipase D
MDPTTLKKLWARFRPRFVLPLGNAQDLRDNGIPDSHITSLDWWQHRVVVVEIEVQNTTTTKVATALAVFEITCVPSQHQSNRGPLDRNAGLWSGFTITSLMPYTRKALEASRMPSALSSMESTQFTCYFAGDTGYAYSPDDNVGEERCPAFKEMGARFDGFDLALLPIGSANLIRRLHAWVCLRPFFEERTNRVNSRLAYMQAPLIA